LLCEGGLAVILEVVIEVDSIVDMAKEVIRLIDYRLLEGGRLFKKEIIKEEFEEVRWRIQTCWKTKGKWYW